MKTELKAKLLQHFAGKKKANGGFTLIELLVVIIIIGILSAIALPSFLNQANKAKQSEAKTYVGSLNRGQQAYYLENNQFSPDIATLGIGIPTTTDSYTYTSAGAAEAFSAGVPKLGGTSPVKGYAGGVDIDNGNSIAIMCEALKAPVNGGSPTVTIATVFAATLSSAAPGAPTCVTADYKPLN